MSIQSNVQQLLQASSGLQTQAQSGVPSAVNNGNPNTVYNWSSYIPSILRNGQGQPTGANFNLITSQPQASSPGTGWNTGYTPPFTADPFAAMLMSQLSQYRGPQASQLPGYGVGNSMIDNILRNLIGGYVSTPAPGTGTTPGTGTPPATTTPPTTTTPGTGTTVPNPNTGGGSLGGGGNLLEAGPISMPGTTLPYGTQANLNAAIGNALGQLPVYGGSSGGGTSVGGSSVPVNTGGSFTIPSYGTGATGSAGTNFTPNPYGSGYDLSTGGSPSGGNSSMGGIVGNAGSGALNGIAPANATPGGWFQDFVSTMAGRAGLGGVWDGVDGNFTVNPTTGMATLGTGGANVLAGTINAGINGGINGAVNGSNNTLGGFSMDGPYIGSGMPSVDGLPQGNWSFNDTYTPPNYDFSNLSTGNTTVDPNFDPVAYLEQQRAAETGNTGGNAGAPAGGNGQQAPVNTTVGQGGNGTYTSGPYNGMTEQQVRDMMATQQAFSQMQRDQESARLQAELQAFVSSRER